MCPPMALNVINRRKKIWPATEIAEDRIDSRPRWQETEMAGDRNGRRQRW